MRLAVYGTLRRKYGNHGLISRASATHVGDGWTDEKHALYASGIPYVQKDGGESRVRVEVYDIPEEFVPSIDQLEGHPQWYRREETSITLDSGENVTAWLYFMPGIEEESTHLTLIETGDYHDYR